MELKTLTCDILSNSQVYLSLKSILIRDTTPCQCINCIKHTLCLFPDESVFPIMKYKVLQMPLSAWFCGRSLYHHFIMIPMF